MARIDPYRLHPVPPTIALLQGDAQALDEHGQLHHLERLPKGTRCYGSWDQAEALLRAGVGESYCWDGEPVRWRHRGFPDIGGWEHRPSDVIVIRLPFPDEPERALEGLTGWRDWLGSYRAAPQGSLGSSAMSLLRARLERPLWTARGALPPIRYTLGGRQELAVPPRSTHLDAHHLDLPAAYARTLGEMRYGGVWRELSAGARMLLELEDWAGEGRPVFAHATVRVPALRFGPLPRRLQRRPPPDSWERCEVLGGRLAACFPTGRRMRGTWTAEELLEAARAGCAIDVDRAWIHITEAGTLGQPFLPWWRAVQEGRQMAGLAGLLAKASANALWGQFCITDGKRELVTVTDGVKRSRPLHGLGGGAPRSWDLAELVTGRVRARLAGMMREAGERLLSVHTDGGWLRAGFELEGWTVKDRARRLDLLGPQVLRYWRPGGGRLHRVSGVPAGMAAATFETLWRGAGI